MSKNFKKYIKKLWQNSRPKIKHNTLSNTSEIDGLKNVDINLRGILQCFWVKKLCNKNFHEWKVILLHLMWKTLGQNFKF